MKIEAKGKLNGAEMSVTVTDERGRLEYLFNGKHDMRLQGMIADQIERGAPIGGSYYPESEAMQVYAVLCGFFFDRAPDITADGIDEEIPPPEEGCVY